MIEIAWPDGRKFRPVKAEADVVLLGDSFSIRDFHNVVLRAGSVPLTVLEAEVERYIASGSGG